MNTVGKLYSANRKLSASGLVRRDVVSKIVIIFAKQLRLVTSEAS